MAVGVVAGLLLSGLLGSLWRAAGGAEESLAENAVLQIGLWTALVGTVVLAARRKGSGSVAVDFGFSARRADVPVGLAVGIGAQILLPVLALLLQPLLGDPDVSGPVEDLVDKADGPPFLGLILFTVIGAPVVEELFFRGLLLRSLQKRLNDYWAVALSGIVFGVSHQPDLPGRGKILVMVSLSVFGAVLALLAIRKRRLGPSIAAHATFNAFSVIFVALT